MKTNTKILLIDDNDIDNLIHLRLIKELKASANIKIFQSAKDALHYLTSTAKSNSAELPDIIFLDLYMPMMDGFSFIDEYNKLNISQYKKIKILALSCSIYDREIRKILACDNIADFISKPLSQEKMHYLNKSIF